MKPIHLPDIENPANLEVEFKLFHKRQLEMMPKKLDKFETTERNSKCPCNSGKKYKKCCG